MGLKDILSNPSVESERQAFIGGAAARDKELQPKQKKDRIVFKLPPGIGAELDRLAWLPEKKLNRSEVAAVALQAFIAMDEETKVKMLNGA